MTGDRSLRRPAHVGRQGAVTRAGFVVAASLAAACSSSTNPPNVTGGIVSSEPDSSIQTRSGASAALIDGGTETGELADGAATAGRMGDASPLGADAAAAGEAGGGAVDDGAVPPPSCREGYTWSTTARVPSIAAAGFDRFGAISAPELTVAWMTSSGTIYVADRDSNTNPFGAPVVVDPGLTQLANGRVALMPDGLELIATLADGSSFTAFDRISVGDDNWQPATTDEFKVIAATITESGGAFAEPVVSADGQSLFYLLTIGDALPVLYESAWDVSSHSWQLGQPFTQSDFVSQGATGDVGILVRRPTGVSSDRLTLFYFDEVLGYELGAWRDTPSDPFEAFVDLSNLPEVAPGGDCFYVFFHGTDDAGQGLFTGTGP